MTPPSHTITIRPVEPKDLDTFFEHMQDAEALWQAAFTPPDPTDREVFDAHWAKLFADENVLALTILRDGANVGHIASFEMFGDREITYWIDRSAWGTGVGTAALAEFVKVETTRPLFGRTAKDNTGSIRVMTNNGFRVIGEDRGFATARNEDIDELVLKLG
ncbi:MAG: GNAT family N-acetyltransferase [Acidimicrobiia bacterium]